MATGFDLYDYIISIDIGTTFSGSCFSFIQDKKSIVHVIRWPEQKPEDTFEKTPTACLYSKPDHRLLKWGKSAMDHITATPNDPDVLLIDQFKLKLHTVFQRYRDNNKQLTLEESQYWNAAVDYLREIYQYTCHQLIQTVSPRTASQSDFRFILTVPATWIEDDIMCMRVIATEAGLIQGPDPKERLVIINEAFAASLFCVREFCIKAEGHTKKLVKGQRYLVCDAGGGTVDLATYECTDSGIEQKGHCQLALESGGSCGSTILDQNMEIYLRDQVFLGGVSNSTLKLLVDQFIKEIKHYFGDDTDRNNYRGATPETIKQTNNATTLTTTNDTDMKEIQENDYDYEEDYLNHSDGEQEEMEQDESCYDEDEIYMDEDIFSDDDFVPDLTPIDYVYFTLPPYDESFIPSVIESLHMTGNIVGQAETAQLRIKKTDISKFVFDPVVEKVMSLVRKQIRKSHTTIEILFLLGGFGQSPYLYKKLHYEFITCINAIQHLIVPEDGYRASMRGGIYHGIDCIDIIPKDYNKIHLDMHNNSSTYTRNHGLLVGIDINLFDLTATFSFFSLSRNLPYHTDLPLKELLKIKKFKTRHGFLQKFEFDAKSFLQYNMNRVVETACENPSTMLWSFAFDTLYYSCLIKSFIHQLYEVIQNEYEDLHPSRQWNPDDVRYCVSIAPASKNGNADPSAAIKIPMATLKQQILEKMIELIEVFSPEKVIQIHNNLCDLFDTKAYISIHDEDDIFKTHVYQSAREVGMVKEDSPLKGRIVWVGLSDTSLIRHPYFDISCEDKKSNPKSKVPWLPNIFLEDEETKILTVDLKLFSRRLLVNNELLMPAVGHRIVWEFESLTPDQIRNRINIGRYTLNELLQKLPGIVDFMGPHVHDYIYRHILESPLSTTHKIGSLFFSPNTDQHMFMRLPEGSTVNKAGLLYAIQRFKDCEITAERIRNILIRPWIKYRLAYMIQAACETYLTCQSQALCVFVSGNIIASNCSAAVASFKFYDILERDIGDIFKKGQILFHEDVDFSRHFACLAHGTNIKVETSGKRVTERRYAVHLLTHDIKKQENMAPYVYSRLTEKTEEDKKKKEEKKKKEKKKDEKKKDEEDDKYDKVLHTIEFGALTLLHPLLDIYESIPSILLRQKPFLLFKVPHECSIAIVLYASEEVKSSDNTISNNNFRKLHRFIFPITDVTKAIEVSCKVDNYELIFIVKQDSYEADYRYVDFLELN